MMRMRPSLARKSPPGTFRKFWPAFLAALLAGLLSARVAAQPLPEVARTIAALSAVEDRSTGTPGAAKAAAYIFDQLKVLGYEDLGRHAYLTPMRVHGGSRISIGGRETAITPLQLNAITPNTVPPPGISGPLVYVGRGSPSEMDGKPVQGAIVLMDMDSGRNWRTAAALGAKALIYVDFDPSIKGRFEDKHELTPLNFPRFFMTGSEAEQLLPGFQDMKAGNAQHPEAVLASNVVWERVASENIFCLVPGADKKLSEELVVIEAFYDSTAWAYGRSPGADEASSVAGLLHLAQHLRENPPGRSVLLVATSGHAQGLAGWREFLWAMQAKGKYLRDLERHQRSRMDEAEAVQKALDAAAPVAAALPGSHGPLAKAMDDELKQESERVAKELMRLRLLGERRNETRIRALTDYRAQIRQLTWGLSPELVSAQQSETLERMLPRIRQTQKAVLTDAEEQLASLRSSRDMRGMVAVREVAACISLYLSSGGDGVGAFANEGFMYAIRPDRNYSGSFSLISRAADRAAGQASANPGSSKAEVRFVNALRPDSLRPWRSWFLDQPLMGGELASLANYVGISLATLNDARPWWGTPYDTPERVDLERLSRQIRFVSELVTELTRTPTPLADERPRLGLATLDGQASFLRQGELFPDQPAPGTVIQAYQDNGVFYAITDTEGQFRLVGVGNKKVIVGKVILEAYRFDPVNGNVLWAIDKRGTGKDAYRVKMNLLFEETRLTMFAADQMTVFNTLEPRTFEYMTKIALFDARRDAEPNRFWYSRIDTRDSTLLSFYLEPGIPLKFTLSDTLLNRKMIMTNAVPGQPEGVGYLPEQWPLIPRTEYHAAKDMWALLLPRIDNLEEHGVVNERIRALRQEGLDAFSEAKLAYAERRYADFLESSRVAWSLASRVYNDVEATQRDVLLGVLFYVALFVPFAYCAERLLFSFADIKKRILALLAILAVVIGIIYNVHPAFQLTYSPLVVILAFFILGLSMLVSLIIFLRFEREMAGLQRRTSSQGAELGRWKALGASFAIGVSNLRRRKMRTLLTTLTLVLLTFTIMSFTAVKSVREKSASLFSKQAPYAGLLMRSLAWSSLPPEAMSIVRNKFRGTALVGPRIWLESDSRTTAAFVPLKTNAGRESARGLVGLSPQEPEISGMDRILVGGRWFAPNEERAILLPNRMAERLGIDPGNPEGATVNLWGIPFTVTGVFDGGRLTSETDLDGEPVTPAIFPSETVLGVAEMEAGETESEQDMRTVQTRYEHVSGEVTVIVPASTAMALGGQLKAMAIRPPAPGDVPRLARHMVDRFGLPLFCGIVPEGVSPGSESAGTYLFYAADTLDYSGLPNVVVPVLISALIVLNTMIASVYERKREIGVYTSVGMPPTHVSFLFVAEALAYAVISVVLGYLLAQIAAQVLAGTPLWAGMTANYSSLGGVAAMILVILVVLASVIYPSKVAGQIAIPDVNRSWSMPEPDGDEMVATLPFLLKRDEQRCVGGYLVDYYKAHEDISHGLFSSDDIAYRYACPMPTRSGVTDTAGKPNGEDECLQMSAKVWLAPFDFGVRQHVQLIFCPARVSPEFLEIQVRLKREAGEHGAWKRINKGFLNDLRRQLLAWRSLGQEDRTRYEDLIVFPTLEPQQA
ncbi:ABC-type antimicrobial peptide transport system, permease component [Desulfocurvibacter africanus PCS]|uniref:ABC-type antimicrobial peptide transport system, permease component n=2 Tax=Desulfocurvibacter africanus TaxID=873 RepID=M5PXV8_DESAF|nr:ABC-type antimicrobial peptide transport system, permease component [Desulfocurvibacter africanus PCS]